MTITVGARELRQKLSHYLDLARSGGVITITEHGKAVARLVAADCGIEERIPALQAAGLIRWKGKGLSPRRPAARLRGKTTVAQLVSEMRE